MTILEIMLRGRIPESKVPEILARVLGVDERQIAPVEGKGAVPVNFSVSHRPEGFQTSIALYVADGTKLAIPASHVSFAFAMARDLGEDALADAPSAGGTPYDWVLVRPTGEMFAISEEAENDGDRFVLDERPEHMKRLDPAAVGVGSSPQGTTPPIEYRAGAESAPYPVGETILRIDSDGSATLEHRLRGTKEEWQGQIQPASLARFFDALRQSTFPTQQTWPQPSPGSSLRHLTVEADSKESVMVPWYAAMKAPGYGDAFRILDEVIGQLSGGAVLVVSASDDVHVVNARRIA